MANKYTPTALDQTLMGPQFKRDGVVYERRAVARLEGEGVTVADDTDTGETVITIEGGADPAGSADDIQVNDGEGGLYGVPMPEGGLVGVDQFQRLSQKELSSPGLQGLVRLGDDESGCEILAERAIGSIKTYPIITRRTSSTTNIQLFTHVMMPNTLAAIDVFITCLQRADAGRAGRYKRSAVYRRVGTGVPELVGVIESGADQETAPGDLVLFSVDSSSVTIGVTAANAAPRNWVAEVRVQETNAT